jgi:uncharacterized protein YfiM (DUF2279 family)
VDPWFAEDKLKHFLTSFVATTISANIVRAAGLDRSESIGVGIAFGVGAGIYKELSDVRAGSFFSVRDLLWDFGGIATATAVLSSSF